MIANGRFCPVSNFNFKTFEAMNSNLTKQVAAKLSLAFLLYLCCYVGWRSPCAPRQKQGLCQQENLALREPETLEQSDTHDPNQRSQTIH